MKEYFSESVKFIRRKISKLSIRKRVMFLYIFLVFIPITMFMFSFYSRTTSIIENEVTKSMLQALIQIEVNINDRLENVVDILNIIFSNADVREAIDSSTETSFANQYDEVSALTKTITSFAGKKDVFNIRMFIDDSKFYSKEGVYFFPISNILKTELYRNVVDANGAIYWQECHLENSIDQKSKQVISAIRMVRSIKNFQSIDGILAVDVREETFYNILSKANLSRNGNILILGETGNIISVNDKSLIGKKYSGWSEISGLNTEDGIIKSKMNASSGYLIFTTIRNTGWKIVAEIPAKDVTGSSSVFNAVTTVITILSTLGVFLLILFIALGWIADSFNKKVKAMVTDIEKEGYGSLNDSINRREGDIYKLENSVSSVIKVVKKLSEDYYKAQLNEQDAKMKALQAQINPHFLYNTLDVIRWMAFKQNAPGVAKLVESLAKYFRLSLSKGKDLVTIMDEVNLAKVYMDIQRHRFGDNIKMELNIEEEAFGYYIPKLILQPLIENAIIHGVLEKEDKTGVLIITVKLVDEYVEIQIKDDGVGIKAERINKLMEGRPINSDEKSMGSSYGLLNVKQRLENFTGETPGIKIESEYGKGTSIYIRIPRNKRP